VPFYLYGIFVSNISPKGAVINNPGPQPGGYAQDNLSTKGAKSINSNATIIKKKPPAQYL